MGHVIVSHIFLLIGYLFWVWLCIVWAGGWLLIVGNVYGGCLGVCLGGGFVVRCSGVWTEGVFVRGCWDKCLWRLYGKCCVKRGRHHR